MTRVIDAPVDVVWEVFTDLSGRVAWLSEVERVVRQDSPRPDQARWRQWRVLVDRDGAPSTVVDEDLVLTTVEPGRTCTVALAASVASDELAYVFTPIRTGPRRGGTAVTALVRRRPARFSHRVLGFMVGTFAARTAEGALRAELAALARACHGRVGTGTRTAA